MNDYLKKLTYLATIMLLGVIATSNIAAADPPDFSGTWVRMERKSLSGTDYSNGMPKQIDVKQSSDRIAIERVTLDESDKEVTAVDTLSLNGQPTVVTTPSNREKAMEIYWLAGQQGFVLTKRYSVPGKREELDYTHTERWALSEDRSTLTIIKEVKSPTDPWSMSGEYVLKKPGEVFGIQFMDDSSWQQVLTQARKDNKYIFVDCYATWCGPCKQMDSDIYPSKKVGEYFNPRFISVRVQMDQTPKDSEHVRRWYEDATALREKHDINALPTLLFFAPDGTLVRRDAGSKTVQEFIGLAKQAVSEATATNGK